MTDLPLCCASCGHSSGDTLAIPLHTPQHTFQKFVIEGESQIQSLENRIEQAKNLLNQLEVDLKRTQVAVKEHKDMLNPVRRLPFDVLREIFSVGAGLRTDVGSHFRSTSHYLNLNSPPWVYGRVCHSWNEVTVNTPLLWTRIKVVQRQIAMQRQFQATASLTVKGRVYSGTSAVKIPLSFSLLSLYLSRSDNLPLAVSLDLRSMPIFSATLFSSSRRWASLSLAGNLPAAFANGSFPLLKHIQSEEEEIRGSDLIDITAPSLRSWSTMGFILRSARMIMSPRLRSQITEYSISRISVADALRIVEQLPCLSKLTRRFPEAPLSLVVLSELILEQSTTSNIDGFIDSITCPALTSLYITTHAVSVIVSTRNLEARSSFNLECLDITAQAGLSLIENTRGIKKFVVRSIGDTTDYNPFVSFDDVLSRLSVMSASEYDSGSPLGFNETEDSELSAADYFAKVQSWSGANDLASTQCWSTADEVNSEEAEVFTDFGHSTSKLFGPGPPFPNLQRLELHFCSSPTLDDSDIMPELLACVISRSTSGIINATLAEIFITSPDHLAREMLNHPCLKELRSMGLKVDILGF
ncbi:hypothetical protein BDP27DRAFT_1325992 [Rhodocollybia butyracea]|uniref:F-box domain-containing protein n=1 Tax=Rhodocollybia butyracea TaxID=206335 RepID=A0A9P5PTX7_9AGAR|nr:hypothetical protein BDP27DRAFT_1325992 [Rhodocollybia butyracea]